MQMNGYHHIGLITDDSARSLKFYTEGLGGKVVHSFPMGGSDKIIYLVDLGGNAVIEIIPRGNDGEEANARFAHIAIRVDDARAAFAKALSVGAKEKTAPNDLSLGTMPVCIAFVLGPDGETLEFFQVK